MAKTNKPVPSEIGCTFSNGVSKTHLSRANYMEIHEAGADWSRWQVKVITPTPSGAGRELRSLTVKAVDARRVAKSLALQYRVPTQNVRLFEGFKAKPKSDSVVDAPELTPEGDGGPMNVEGSDGGELPDASPTTDASDGDEG